MIKREQYLEKIEPFIGSNIIKVLVGVRRCGKSTILEMLCDRFKNEDSCNSNILHMRFESSLYADIKNAHDLTKYVHEHVDTSKPCKLLFDEIQEVEGWEMSLRSFMVDLDADIYVTGSNAYVLSSDLATFITGRYVSIDIFPLSFSEFFPSYAESHEDATKSEAFRAYLMQGGFPFQCEFDFESIPSFKYLEDLFSTILLEDVVRRNNVRDVDLLKRLMAYVSFEIGHLLSVKNISDYLKSNGRKASPETVANYLEFAEKAFFLYRVPREDTIGKKTLAYSEKCYIVDQGLRQALGFSNQANIDQVLENIVFIELLRRGYSVRVGKVGDREIDFIAHRDGKIEYYQVSYILDSEQTRTREFSSLMEIDDNYPKYVLSMDEFDMSHDGIVSLNLIDWLLDS